MTGDYELLPSSSIRPNGPSPGGGSARIATPTTSRRPSGASSQLRLYLALGRKSPVLALVVVIAALALAHEVLVLAGHAAQLVLGDGLSVSPTPVSKEAAAWADVLGNYSAGAAAQPKTVPGAHFRDLHPLQSAAHFLELADSEIQALGLSTCGGRLSTELALAYNSTAMQFCSPMSASTPLAPKTDVTCFPNYHSPFLKWWPYPASYCLSSNVLVGPRMPPQDQHPQQYKLFGSRGCALTPLGESLKDEMGNEKFLGSEMENLGQAQCDGGRVDHPLLFVGRQDQWNPFHVAEDFVTTFLAMVLAGFNRPSLLDASQRLQLVFTDEFEVSKNHFTTVWDRIGSHPPRRMSLDPFNPRTCVSQAIHSIGAGASLLSASGVSKRLRCASALTWGASHYYRFLFGLPPTQPKAQAINVLWLSRAQMERIALDQNDWSTWRETRHIDNEAQLVARFKTGMASLCEGASRSCRFSSMDQEPERWAMDGCADDGQIELRFATIDPVTQAIETQIDFVGHSTILVGLHGGSLGLSLFLPPGPHSNIIELKPPGTDSSYHFHNMAAELGATYAEIGVIREVDVDAVWSVVRGRIEAELGTRLARR